MTERSLSEQLSRENPSLVAALAWTLSEDVSEREKLLLSKAKDARSLLRLIEFSARIGPDDDFAELRRLGRLAVLAESDSEIVAPLLSWRTRNLPRRSRLYFLIIREKFRNDPFFLLKPLPFFAIPLISCLFFIFSFFMGVGDSKKLAVFLEIIGYMAFGMMLVNFLVEMLSSISVSHRKAVLNWLLEEKRIPSVENLWHQVRRDLSDKYGLGLSERVYPPSLKVDDIRGVLDAALFVAGGGSVGFTVSHAEAFCEILKEAESAFSSRGLSGSRSIFGDVFVDPDVFLLRIARGRSLRMRDEIANELSQSAPAVVRIRNRRL